MAFNPTGYAFLGLTAIVAGLVGILVFALLRFSAAAIQARGQSRESGGEIAVLSAALQEAVANLRAQERATAARAEASERLSEEIISSLTAGLLVVDLGGAVTILNRAGRRVLGLAEGSQLLRTTEAAPLFAVIDECLAHQTAIVRRTVNLPAVGRGVYVGVTVSPLSDGSGRLDGAICLFTDLTSVRALEEQLRLKESLATVGELTAGIAHEFRNGLATIHGYSKLIDLDAIPPSHRPYVEGIRAETQSLSEIVTNFLNFARPAELTLSRVELGAVCERVAEELRPEAAALGGTIDLHGVFGSVEGDEVLIRQAFSNLLRNAVEACSGASIAPAVSIESEIDRDHKLVRLAVTDNGPGIDPRAREQVFRPFFTSKRQGTGLGLALVQKILVFHNGQIHVGRSAAGGASFDITLPLSE